MKKEFSVVELACVVKELQLLVGGRINKVLQYSDKWLAFECFKTGVGRVFINICRPGLLWVGKSKFESGEFGFHKNLVKQIGVSKIISIVQIGSERIVKIDLKSGEKNLVIYIELFNKGELVLCDSSGKILSLWETQLWKYRELKVGSNYILPKKLFNIFEVSESEFFDLLGKIDETISKSIATELGIGGVYANELCDVSGVDKNKKMLSSDELRVLHANIQFLLKRKIDARIIYTDKEVKDIVPYALKSYDSFKQKSAESYCAALDEVLSNIEQKEQSTQALSQFELKKRKLNNIIEVQKLHLSAVQNKSESEQKKGELIYENYQKLKEILDGVVKAREKFSFKEIKAKSKELGINDFDDKTGEIIVEI